MKRCTSSDFIILKHCVVEIRDSWNLFASSANFLYRPTYSKIIRFHMPLTDFDSALGLPLVVQGSCGYHYCAYVSLVTLWYVIAQNGGGRKGKKVLR